MKCPLCGYRFSEEEGQACQQGCPFARSCRLLRCPSCGYEMPPEPKWLKALRAWRSKDNEAGRES